MPGTREIRILCDPHGKLAEFKAEAEAFEWMRLQAVANAYVSYSFHTSTEEMHKLLGGLETDDPSKVVYATLGLGLTLAKTRAVHKCLGWPWGGRPGKASWRLRRYSRSVTSRASTLYWQPCKPQAGLAGLAVK